MKSGKKEVNPAKLDASEQPTNVPLRAQSSTNNALPTPPCEKLTWTYNSTNKLNWSFYCLSNGCHWHIYLALASDRKVLHNHIGPALCSTCAQSQNKRFSSSSENMILDCLCTSNVGEKNARFLLGWCLWKVTEHFINSCHSSTKQQQQLQ